jgi:hypothetical protein
MREAAQRVETTTVKSLWTSRRRLRVSESAGWLAGQPAAESEGKKKHLRVPLQKLYVGLPNKQENSTLANSNIVGISPRSAILRSSACDPYSPATILMERPSKLARSSSASDSTAIVVSAPGEGKAATSSSLEAPSMLLEKGHTALILSLAFSFDGRNLATCSKDATICAFPFSRHLFHGKSRTPLFSLFLSCSTFSAPSLSRQVSRSPFLPLSLLLHLTSSPPLPSPFALCLSAVGLLWGMPAHAVPARPQECCPARGVAAQRHAAAGLLQRGQDVHGVGCAHWVSHPHPERARENSE